MEKVAVKVPDGQKEKLDEIAENEGYPNKSEFLREVIRDEINKREIVKKELIEELEKRKTELENGEIGIDDLISNKELKEELGTE